MKLKLHITLLVALFLFSALSLMAATIKGKLLDENKEPMIGAHVMVKGMDRYSIVGLDGSYSISNVPVGNHILSASFVGYIAQEKLIAIISNDEIVVLEFNLEQDQSMLNEVVVLGSAEQGSELEARLSEKSSNQVLNIISSKTIDMSPDITVANVVQRVSGVSLVRNSNGDPQYAIVRGMDKRYNYTLVNGIKIPSPDNQNRYIPLDIFPAQLLQRLEVSKSLTPNMEGDAIGGVVNMVMKSAPETFTVKGDLQIGYNQIFLKRDFLKFDKSAVDYKTPWEKYGSSYRAQIADFSKKNLDITSAKPLSDIITSLSVGNRFFTNKLGVLLAGSFQNSYRGTNSVWFYALTDGYGSNLPSLESVQERTYSTQQTRTAFHTKMDYRINEKNTINLYAGNYHLVNSQTRDLLETQLDARNYDEEAGNAILTYSTRTRITDQNIFNTTLQGDHKIASSFRINWSAVYSKAKSNQPDNAQFDRNSGLVNHTLQPQIVDRSFPRKWEHNTDQDFTGYLNILYTPAFLGKGGELAMGGMYRKKDRNNFYNQYNFGPVPSEQAKGVDWETYSDVNLTILNPLGGTYTTLNYDANEDLLDYYGQAKFTVWQKLQVVTGVRVEDTNQGYRLTFPSLNEAPDSAQHYVDALPSVSFKYMHGDQVNVRASYYKAISRAGYFEIVPYQITNEDYSEVGNPKLKHVRAHNFDLRWEYFPNTFDQILIGAFYKKILDPIEYALVPYGGTGGIALQPGNYGTANNWGIEVDYTKYFNRFGVKANYTFTNSRITTTKLYRTRQDPNDQTSQIVVLYPEQTRPLQGQAKHIANLSLLFKDQHSGTNLQLAFVYTGERIENVSPFLDNDTWQKPILQMDFSAEQRIGKYFDIFLKAQNLLNSPYEVVIKKPHSNPDKDYKLQDSSTSTLIRKDQYFQSYRIGIRYSL